MLESDKMRLKSKELLELGLERGSLYDKKQVYKFDLSVYKMSCI